MCSAKAPTVTTTAPVVSTPAPTATVEVIAPSPAAPGSTRSALDTKRRGRSSLRILGNEQASSASTGLSITPNV